MKSLHERIKDRISAIPARNPNLINFYPTTLDRTLSHALIEKIADEATKEAQEYYSQSKGESTR